MPPIAPETPDTAKHELGLRTVAAFEAFKGIVVLIAGSGFLALVHRDAQALAERIVRHLHLDPASHYPRIFVELASKSSPGRLRLLALGALLYAIMRIVEAVGLWHGRRWAEWFGVATGLIYVPFEVVAIVNRPRIGAFIALAISLGIVMYLAIRLQKGRERARPKSP